jgi:hypothetical protein
MARWGIRVVFTDGRVGFLRHGPISGTGPIVRFPNKKTAEVNLDFIREGLDADATASIFKILDKPKQKSKAVA